MRDQHRSMADIRPPSHSVRRMTARPVSERGPKPSHTKKVCRPAGALFAVGILFAAFVVVISYGWDYFSTEYEAEHLPLAHTDEFSTDDSYGNAAEQLPDTGVTGYADEEIASTTGTTAALILGMPRNKKASTTTRAAVVRQESAVSVPQKPQAPLNYAYGMAMGETLSVVSEAELARQLDTLAALGVGWIRVDFSWSSIQRDSPTQFRWEPTDRIVVAANARGIKVLPILVYTPAWARSIKCPETNRCEPQDPAAYADFARAAAVRYAPQGVHVWEIWNEPNIRLFWRPAPDAAYYRDVLKAAFEAIHGVDANATVISGGLAPAATANGNIAPLEFIRGLYEADGKPYFDALGFHPYSFPVSPAQYKKTSAWSQLADTGPSVRSIMTEYGDSAKQVWLTEFGAPTGGPGSEATGNSWSIWDVPDHVTEAYQAQMLSEAAADLKNETWDGPLFWYSYKDLGTDSSTKENFFGILRYDGSQKPVYGVMREVTR